MKIIDKIIKEEKPYIIAEIGNNHQGSFEIAKEMIELAAKAGADAVKFQKRNNKSLFTKQYYNSEYNSPNRFANTYGEHREYLELSKNDFEELIIYAHNYNLDFIMTFFDIESYEEMKDFDIDAIKIASGDVTNSFLIEHISKCGKTILLSTGAATLDEVMNGISIVKKYTEDIVLFHCVSQYPAENKNLNLNIIKKYKELYPNIIIGYSGHDIGILASLCAYSLGAAVIEKHFTINKNLKGTDHKMSLDPEELHELVKNLRLIEEMKGKDEKKLNAYEVGAREKMGKGVYAKHDIFKGEKLLIKDIVFKSPEGDGISVDKISLYIGKTINKNIAFEEIIDESVFK